MLQPDGSARRRRPLFRATVVAISSSATLLALEVGLRVRAASENAKTLERAMSQLEQPTDDLDAGLGNIIRLSANDKLIYELQPMLVGRSYHGARVTTDARGFRIARPPEPPDPGALTILGIIALSGMIMRNAVILIDQVRAEVAAGSDPWNAIVNAAVQRARPVVLTGLATALAMIPLTSSVFWGPMAIAMMGGLIVATVLTIFFVPALYAAWFRIARQGVPETNEPTPTPVPVPVPA
jgi:hypothetical protein